MLNKSSSDLSDGDSPMKYKSPSTPASKVVLNKKLVRPKRTELKENYNGNDDDESDEDKKTGLKVQKYTSYDYDYVSISIEYF